MPIFKTAAPTMQHATQHKEVHSANPDNNWKKQPDIFTGDDIIDAYLLGKRQGQNDYTRVLLSQLQKNLIIATSAAERLFAEMSEKGFVVQGAYLKAEGITNFNVLILVQQSDYLADDFRSVFTIARKIKESVLNDTFHLSFAFMPHSNNLNRDCIHSDGYFLKYDKVGPLSKTRKS